MSDLKPYDKSSKISSLLVRGRTIKQAGIELGIPYQTARRLAISNERKGIIERTEKYPILYRLKSKPYDNLKPVGDLSYSPPIKPLLIPHRFGCSASLLGRPNLVYDKHGKARIKVLDDHIIEFGRGRAQIWLKGGYQGISPSQIIELGRVRLNALASHYAKLYGVIIAIERYYEDIEWILNNKAASKDTGDKIGIDKNEKIEIGGVDYVLGDSSHPEYLELNKATNYPPHLATEHSKVLFLLGANRPTIEYLVRDAPTQFRQFAESVQLYDANIKKHLEIMNEMGKTLKEIRDSLKKVD